MNDKAADSGKSDIRPFNLHLRLPPLPRSARTGRDALLALAAFHDVASLDIESLTFALGEALANAIEHAGSDAEIDVSVTIDARTIVATVRDRGSGFAGAPHETVPFPDLSAEGGRGFPIMQCCTDFFEVQSMPGDGTVVTLGRLRRDS
ncbi:MAG: ATP-binding protein [Candidatus Eremiobacteraeota bacterium]|nr:ATP-binding protein [Candidatus Eremiobacteraeota bacterium]MBV8373331.1 ATP-binding protein [Candidatus Eremiobacteraeota bacterium]